MAVTKIRKISSWSLLSSMLLSVLVLAIFFFGGITNPGEEMKEPVYTSLLLNWMYLLFGVAIGVAFLFAIWQFITTLKDSPKSAMMSLGVVVLFAAMFLLTYSIGGGEPLKMIGYEGGHNVSFWLKLTDMWLYSSYILMALIVISVAVGSAMKALNK